VLRLRRELRRPNFTKSISLLAPVSLVAACPAPADLAAVSSARQAKKRDDEMRNGVWVLVVLLVLSLVAGCSRSGTTATELSPHMPQPADALEPASTPDLATVGSAPACPPATGEGTVSPAVSIYSIVFTVSGAEQVVRDGDVLQALPGEQVQVREVTICVGSFSGNGGEACVDLVPVDQSGQEIASEHRGTHTVSVTPGFTSISGPDQGWIIGENWRNIAAVVNHWPPDGTQDLGCGGGRCERDDRTVVGLR